MSFFLFDPRPRPFRVLRSPAFAAGAATPYGHDRAAAEAAHVAGTGRRALGALGFEVTDDGWVIQAAPVAAWTVGRRGRQVVTYYRQRGGRVSWQQVPARLRYAGHVLTGSVEELRAAVDALDADTVPESYYQKVLAGRSSVASAARALAFLGLP